MNQQTQNSPSKPFEPVTVSTEHDENLVVSVRDAATEFHNSVYDETLVCVSSGDESSPYHSLCATLQLTPHEASRLAQVLLGAAESTRDPVASRIFGALKENVARHKEARQLAEARDDDTDPDTWTRAEKRRRDAWSSYADERQHDTVGGDLWDTRR